MRKFYLMLFFMGGLTNGYAQETLPFFSDLSNQSAYETTFDAVALDNNLYYYINDYGALSTIVYKLDDEGVIVASKQLDTGYFHTGNFFLHDNRLFFDGLRAKDSINKYHTLIEFDSDLNIVLAQNWLDIVPPNAAMMIWRSSQGINTFDRGSRMIRNDTLFSVMPYAIDVSGFGPFLPRTMYEVLGLDGSVYYTKFLKNIDSLYYHTYTTFGSDAFYLFGYMEGPTAPEGDSFGNGGLMGRFNLSTGVVESTSWFNDPFIGNGTDGSVGQYLNGRLYCSSFTQSALLDATYAGSGCPQNTVVLEVRTPNLALIKGYNLPVCGFKTNGGKSFATDADGFIYYANYNYTEGLTYVFKFDSLLNPIWQKKYAIAFPYSVLYTTQGHIILNCITNLLNPILQIHRIDAQNGEIVNLTELPLSTSNTLSYYPNPFSATVQTDVPNALTSQLSVFNLQGQLVAEIAPPCTQANLSSLPSGTYLFKMQDPTTRQLIGQQWLIKKQVK
jgi:Secretion system C-terminal sorting domain